MSDLDALIRILYAAGDAPDLCERAEAVLASDWLAERERKAAERALREQAAEFREHGARSWGGDQAWLTTGTKVANLVADWCDESADREVSR